MRFFISFILLLTLVGCVADQKQTQAPVLNTPAAPIINIPLPATPLMDPNAVRAAVGTEMERVAGPLASNMKNDVVASSNNTQQQLSGLVTTQVSKLAESIKGVEANLNTTINTEIRPQLTATATAVANVELKLNASIAATANLQNTMTATVTNSLTATNEMKLSLDRLSAQMQALGAAQAGVGNKIDQQTSAITAGGNVNNNNFPKEAVTVMLEEQKSSTRQMLALLGVLQVVITLILRNSRERERMRAETEKADHQRTFDLLMEAMSDVDPAKAPELKAKLATHPAPQPAPKGFFRNLI